MSRSEQNRKAANTRWAKHREKMRELRDEVLSLQEANEERMRIIMDNDRIIYDLNNKIGIMYDKNRELGTKWMKKFDASEKIKKDCQREKISLLTDKKALTNLCYALERENKVLKVGVLFLLAVAGSLGVYLNLA